MYDFGDLVPLTVDIRDTSGVLANAGGAVTLTITQPDGVAVTPTVTNPTVGRYQCDFAPTQTGRHAVRWVATGTNASAYSDVFDVRPSTPDFLLSLAEAKAQLNISPSVTTDDEELRAYIEGTTSVVESHLNKILVRRSVSEDITVKSCYVDRLALRHLPVISLTSLAAVYPSFYGSYTYDVSTLRVDATTGLVSGLTVPVGFSGNLRVVYTAGYAVIPSNYTLAAKMILQDNWNTQRQPGIGPPGLFGGSDIITTPSGMSFTIPPRAVALLGPRAPVLA